MMKTKFVFPKDDFCVEGFTAKEVSEVVASLTSHMKDLRWPGLSRGTILPSYISRGEVVALCVRRLNTRLSYATRDSWPEKPKIVFKWENLKRLLCGSLDIRKELTSA